MDGYQPCLECSRIPNIGFFLRVCRPVYSAILASKSTHKRLRQLNSRGFNLDCWRGTLDGTLTDQDLPMS